MKRKRAEDEEDSEVEDPGMQNDQPAAAESDDEVEYYRQAVGEEPDEGEYMLCALTVGSCLAVSYWPTPFLCRHVPER